MKFKSELRKRNDHDDGDADLLAFPSPRSDRSRQSNARIASSHLPGPGNEGRCEIAALPRGLPRRRCPALVASVDVDGLPSFAPRAAHSLRRGRRGAEARDRQLLRRVERTVGGRLVRGRLGEGSNCHSSISLFLSTSTMT